ncbi:MAG: quinone-dependent dihydroorotate dehydrogenase [Chloroflexota bacterium]|nr:quinone-dependent dihydroorotate dehydrogenase [Chloroflexota bacterium]
MQTQLYKAAVSPLLDRLDSETWHERARHALHYAEHSRGLLRLLEHLASPGGRFVDRRLAVELDGIQLENPVLVGAGWDKSGIAVRGLYALGFSGVEVGSVLEAAQPGNPGPRQWMVAPGVALNRLGFNSPGVEAVARNLERYRGTGIPIGISLGKNRSVPPSAAPEAHAAVASRLYDYAAYFAINVSSPNTPGLRALQDKRPLGEIVAAVNEAMDARDDRKPVFVKVAPELSDHAILDVIEVVADHGLSGIIATNSTDDPELKARYGERWRHEPGGLSGDDRRYRALSTAKVARIYAETRGRIQIIGVGGVKDAPTALEKLQAGATAVQVVTAIRGEGIAVASRINRGLAAWLDREGVGCLSEVVGAQHRSALAVT